MAGTSTPQGSTFPGCIIIFIIGAVLLMVGINSPSDPPPTPVPNTPAPSPAVKHTLVIIGGHSCPACRSLEHSLVHPSVQGELTRFTVTNYHDDRAANRKYHVSAYPTLVIINPAGTEVARREGSLSPSELVSWLKPF